MHSEIRQIDLEQAQILAELFPDLAGVDPGGERALLEQALKKQGAPQVNNWVTHALAQISLVVGRFGVSLSEISYRNSELVVVCVLKNFSQVEQLNSQLNRRAKIQSKLESSTAEDGSIYATYTLAEK